MKRIAIISACLFIGGCFSPDPNSLKSEYAVNKIPAIKEAADKNDVTAFPELVKDLDDNDSAIRAAAIDALHQMTGQTMEYRYYDDAPERKPAVMRWQHWLQARQAGTTGQKS